MFFRPKISLIVPSCSRRLLRTVGSTKAEKGYRTSRGAVTATAAVFVFAVVLSPFAACAVVTLRSILRDYRDGGGGGEERRWSVDFLSSSVPLLRGSGTGDCGFGTGYDFGGHERDDAQQQPPSSASLSPHIVLQALLDTQIDIQNRFQSLIRTRQHPPGCSSAMLLVKLPESLDGFALEFRTMARSLQVAFATGRTLVVSTGWKSSYEPEQCRWDEDGGGGGTLTGWPCVMEPLSNCAFDAVSVNHEEEDDNEEEDANWEADLEAAGTLNLSPQPQQSDIITGRNTSKYFDVRYYSSRHRIVKAPKWPWSPTSNIDIVPGGWERTYGRFWIRAQMSHMLWKPSEGLARAIQHRTPGELLGEDVKPYICFHIRYTDNIPDLDRDFGRNGTITRSFDRFMYHAEAFRTSNPDMDLNTIYLATDYVGAISQSRQPKWKSRGWRFLTQTRPVQRASSFERMWFKDGRKAGGAAIATDLEVMRRADFLVGSLQSNVYRLGAELNMAWNVGRYPLGMERVRTVDVEWYEDP